MSRSLFNIDLQLPQVQRRELRTVWIFCAITMVLSIILFLLLPGIAGPAVAVFIPTLTAAILIAISSSAGEVRKRLFSTAVWRINLKWALISLGTAVALCLGIILLRLLLAPAYQWQPGPVSPALLLVFLFAAAEEIGWRGFALRTLVENGYAPLTAALVLGVPWALLHMPLVLPGMLNAGAPPVAQLLMLLALSVLITWVYLGAGFSLSAAVLLHGGQNLLGIAVLSVGVSPALAGWLNAAVYCAAALLVILLTRGRLGLQDGPQVITRADR